MPDIVEGLAQEKWYRPRQEVLIGQEILELDPELSEFNVHFPIRRGELNLHKNVGGGLMSVLIDLQAIWEHVLKYRLHIKLNDLYHYKAVLVIPNIYNRSHLKELTTILLTHMGFGSCFLGEFVINYYAVYLIFVYSSRSCGCLFWCWAGFCLCCGCR